MPKSKKLEAEQNGNIKFLYPKTLITNSEQTNALKKFSRDFAIVLSAASPQHKICKASAQ